MGDVVRLSSATLDDKRRRKMYGGSKRGIDTAVQNAREQSLVELG